MKKSIYRKYEALEETMHELMDRVQDYEKLNTDNFYLHQFLNFKGLNDEFDYFKEHAHPEEDENNPFPPLVL